MGEVEVDGLTQRECDIVTIKGLISIGVERLQRGVREPGHQFLHIAYPLR